jgi:hypothetical protein
VCEKCDGNKKLEKLKINGEVIWCQIVGELVADCDGELWSQIMLTK